MEFYSEYPRCSKCGYEDASSVYTHDYAGFEYVQRVCGRCGYGWSEKPLDHEEEQCE